MSHTTKAAERHQSEHTERECQERLSYSLDAAGLVGTWDWHIQSNNLYCDARLAALLSLDPRRSEAGVPPSEYPSAVHPEDVERTKEAIERAIATGEKFSHECRLIQGDGSLRWVLASGECRYDPDAKPLRFAGAVVDITARKLAEEQLRKRTHRLEAFDRVSKSISSDLDLERIVQTVTDIATELSGAKFGAFSTTYSTTGVNRSCSTPSRALRAKHSITSACLATRRSSSRRFVAGGSFGPLTYAPIRAMGRLGRTTACRKGTCRSSATLPCQ